MREYSSKTPVTYHLPRVTCHMSPVTCHLSKISKYQKSFFSLKKIEQSGGASRWRVCYQRGLPRLVSEQAKKQVNICGGSSVDWGETKKYLLVFLYLKSH